MALPLPLQPPDGESQAGISRAEECVSWQMPEGPGQLREGKATNSSFPLPFLQGENEVSGPGNGNFDS